MRPMMRLLGRSAARAVEEASPDVLELRVHGVANTPPAAMLGLDPTQIEQVDGDQLGSFWAATPRALGTERPEGDPRVPPPGVRREGYSWGAMARLSTVPAVGRASGLVAGVIRALWVLIIPFGLANVAYWSRDADEPSGIRRPSAAGGLVRMFGLVLTLLWVATAATVALGIVGAQCYGPRTTLDVAVPGGVASVDYVQTCTALPDQLDSWARWSSGSRTAVLAVLAAAAVLTLAAVGSTGRLRYERRMSGTKSRGRAPGTALDAGKPWPMLARPGFWTHSQRSSVLWYQHLAASFALLAVLLAWHFLYRGEPQCWQATGMGARGCLGSDVWAAAGNQGWAAMIGLGILLLVVVAWRVARLRLDPLPHGSVATDAVPDRAVSRATDAALFLVGVALFGWAVATVATSGDAPLRPADASAVPFLGLAAVPSLLIGLMVVLCVVAVGLRARLWAGIWVPAVVLSVGGAVIALLWPDGAGGVVTRSVVAVAFVGLLVVAVRANVRHPSRAREGWAGRGPFVLLATAAGVAMVLSAATVLGVVAWLEAPGAPENATAPEQVTAALEAVGTADRLRDPVVVDAASPVRLVTPPGYVEFAVMSVAVLVVGVLLMVVLAARMGALRTKPLPVIPGDNPPPRPEKGVDQAVQRGRRHAALAHRAERIVGIVGTTFFLALVGTLLLPDPDKEVTGFWGDLWALGVQWSTKAVVLVFALVVASVVGAGSKKALARPWGLLWDLMCFLPRAAHPFAPPCYAERVVPELRGRIDTWLGDDRDPATLSASRRRELADRRVVLSAHSLGGVVAVAALLARWDGPAGPCDDRVALLTYGTQLRAYFGRFFPELFGPAVLGTTPAGRARLWAADPWTGVAPGPVTSETLTVVESLTAPGPGGVPRTRWRSLWRRTDFIGFPVDAYADDGAGIDHPAQEVDGKAYLLTIAAHSGYPAAPEYRAQLDDLVRTLRGSGG
ncbi:proline dehydrogenase family protein [Cellulomonas edaphi]|uniref:Fungal lipase-like domain-containing protein n=1 Tax=Cellulomonas edaphi TaxID=3053468 RepID=A0ABT7S5R7_9CELL|nr:hypothetical protein [Cellulomons edaphi]MDM7830969.1 hypothetical protein [Cellulomons edaphi]